MLTLTVGTLLFVARTAIVSSAGAFGQDVQWPNYLSPDALGQWKIQMEEELFELLKEITIVTVSSKFERSGMESVVPDQRYTPVTPDYEPLLSKALKCWASKLKGKRQKSESGKSQYWLSVDKDVRQDEIAERYQKWPMDNDVTSKEVQQQFPKILAWRERDHYDDDDCWLLIIRSVAGNLYEVVSINVGQQSHKYTNSPSTTANLVYVGDAKHSEKVDLAYRFVTGHGNKPLRDISELFAEQRIQEKMQFVREYYSRESFDVLRRKLRDREWFRRHSRLSNQQSGERDAIQRDWSENLLSRAAVYTESTRCQSETEMDELKRKHAAEEKRIQQEIVRVEDEAARVLKEERARTDADKVKMIEQFETKQSDWNDQKELMTQQLETQSKNLDAKKMKTEKAIRKVQSTNQRLQNENDGLRNDLVKSREEIKSISDHVTRAHDEESKLLGENRDLIEKARECQSQLDALREEMVTMSRQHEEQMTKSEEKDAQSQREIVALQQERIEMSTRMDEQDDEMADTQRQFDAERARHTEQLDEQQGAVLEIEQKLREKQEGIDHWIMVSVFMGGGILVVIGFAIFQLARWTYNEMYDHMEYELNAQLKRVKEPHPLVPEYPSAHANRLGVHEHPAVRDVFGMKEPWDVTPGEGFHVSRITKGGRTPGTTRGEVDDETTGVPVMEGMNEGEVMEQDKEQMAESAENFDI